MRSRRLRSMGRSRAGRVTAASVALAALLAPGGYPGGAPGASGNLLADGDAGYASQVRFDHYPTARTVEAAPGLAPVTANDAYATPYNDVFTGWGR